MARNTFFKEIPTLIQLKLINNHFKLIKKKDKKINKKYYKYYTFLIKQYRYLGIFPNNSIIKFINIK